MKAFSADEVSKLEAQALDEMDGVMERAGVQSSLALGDRLKKLKEIYDAVSPFLGGLLKLIGVKIPGL